MRKMKFPCNMYLNDSQNPVYVAGKVYDIEDKSVARWLKRGGEIVGDAKLPAPAPTPAPVAHPIPEVPAAPVEEKPEHVEEAEVEEQEKPVDQGRNQGRSSKRGGK